VVYNLWRTRGAEGLGPVAE